MPLDESSFTAKLKPKDQLRRAIALARHRIPGISTGLNFVQFIEIIPDGSVMIRPDAEEPKLSLGFLGPLHVLVGKQRELAIWFCWLIV